MRSTELYPCLSQPPGTSNTMLTRPKAKKLSTRWLVRAGVLFGIFATSTLIFASSSVRASHNQIDADPSVYNTRQLLSTGDTNVTNTDSCNTLYEVNHVPALFVVIYLILIFILFISLAIICDDFFVPSLEAISERLELSEDVAGATFMAAGSSAPELFISIIGVSKESDVGVGTIVGSAVFNILIIIALTAALAGQVLELDWRPLVRDCICYGLSIICFIIFTWDGVIHIEEAIILLVLYAAYIVLMKFSGRIMNISCKRCRKGRVEPLESGNSQDEMAGSSTKVVAPGDEAFTPAVQLQKNTSVHSDRKMSVISNKSFAGVQPSASNKHIFHHVKHGELAANFATKRHSIVSVHHEHTVPQVDENQPKEKVIEDDEEIEEELTLKPIPCLPAISMYYPDRTEVVQSRCGCLRLVLKWAMFIVSFPFMCAFTWTIPNCSNPKYKRFYMVSFLMSILWIAALSTGMVTLVERTGCVLNIDHYFMGLVFVAVGTSVPDALSSILVARDGFGDMAISNAIGSNVFDINLGLGLPFFIRILITSSPINLLSEMDKIMLASGNLIMTPHAKFGFILLAILFFTLFVFCGVRFRLNKCVGISFVMLYVAFIVYALLQEFACKYTC